MNDSHLFPRLICIHSYVSILKERIQSSPELKSFPNPGDLNLQLW